MKRLSLSIVLLSLIAAACTTPDSSRASGRDGNASAVSRVVVIGKIKVKPDQVTEFSAAAQRLVAASRAESGNLRYYFLRSISAPGEFASIEAWQDEAALQSHLDSSGVAEFGAAIGGFLASNPELRTYTVEVNPAEDAALQKASADPAVVYVLIDTDTLDGGATYVKLVKGEIELTVNEPGNLWDEVYRSKSDPNFLTTFNAWRNADALNTHVAMPYAQKFQYAIADSLKTPPQVSLYAILQ